METQNLPTPPPPANLDVQAETVAAVKGTPHVEPAPAVKVPEGAEETGRFSAYDTKLAKYVGGVHDSKAKATKAAKDRKVESFEIVEV